MRPIKPEAAAAIKRQRLLLGAAAVILLACAAAFWLLNESDVFLPRAHIAIGYMEWGERNYYPNDGDYCYEIGERIAKDGGYYIYSLNGDTQKAYQAVAQGTGWGTGQFSLEHTLFTEEGCTVPLAGTVTGIVIASHSSRFGRSIPASQAQAVLEKIQGLDGREKSTSRITASNNSTAVWICYDNCPVSGVRSGYMESINGQLYFITENAAYAISDTQVVEEWNRISKGAG